MSEFDKIRSARQTIAFVKQMTYLCTNYWGVKNQA